MGCTEGGELAAREGWEVYLVAMTSHLAGINGLLAEFVQRQFVHGNLIQRQLV